jgi:hypothetical protein
MPTATSTPTATVTPVDTWFIYLPCVMRSGAQARAVAAAGGLPLYLPAVLRPSEIPLS